MSGRTKTVAIIGAGVAGIVSAKTAKEAGLQPTVFEKAPYIGGVWRLDGYTWENMHSNVGNQVITFADFPWPDDSLVLPNTRQIYQHLVNYTKKFGIDDRFRTNTTVESVKLLEDKRWQIKSACNGQEVVEVFDFCIIATGYNSLPIIPEEYKSASEIFKGKIMHSAEYKSNDEQLKAKKVLVIGASFSAVEIASNLYGHAESITTLFKNKYLVFPKIIRHKTENGKVQVYTVDVYTTARRCFYPSMEGKIDDPMFVKNIFKRVCPVQTNEALSNPELYIDLEKANIDTLKISISEEFIDYVQSSKIKAKQGYITSFRPDGVVTNDGTFIEADVIIFCTSYRINLPFLDQETLKILNYDERYLNDPIALYKNTWHPDLPNLGFAGMVQSMVCMVGELQAKWITRVFTGKLSLPSTEVMQESVNEVIANREKKKDLQYPYLHTYLYDMLSKEACLLDLEKEKRENPELYDMLWNGPIVPEHFQLNEPEKREAAIERIKTIHARFNREYTQEEAEALNIHNFIWDKKTN